MIIQYPVQHWVNLHDHNSCANLEGSGLRKSTGNMHWYPFPPIKQNKLSSHPDSPLPPPEKILDPRMYYQYIHVAIGIFIFISIVTCTCIRDICQFCTIAGSFSFQISCCNTVLAHLSHYGMIVINTRFSVTFHYLFVT